jgi:hypothetical protein
MLLVGGGMFVHNIEWIHLLFQSLLSVISELLPGLIVGSITVLIIHAFHSKKALAI